MQKRAIFYLLAIGLSFGACTTRYKIKTGQNAFDLKQYALAADMLEEEFVSTSAQEEKAAKAYLLGQTYDFLLKPKSSLEWFEMANQLGYGARAKLAYAYALKSGGEYQKSLQLFNELSKIPTLQQESVKEIRNIEAILSEAKPKGFYYKSNKFSENAMASSYAPAFYNDDFIVFTSDREESSGSQIYGWTSRKFSDLFVTSKNEMKAGIFDPAFNTEFNDGVVCFNKSYTEIFFTRCVAEQANADQFCHLYRSVRSEDGSWSQAEKLPFQKDGVNYGQPALVEGDSVLIFSSQSESGTNSFDLWYTDRFEGEWSEAFPMPEVINTQGNEYFPTANGDTLYFSSDFHPGLGGLDIFKTYLQDGKWSKPDRLPSPINSPADDYSYLLDNKAKGGRTLLKGYFASNRGNQGIDEIYTFEKISFDEVVDKPVDTAVVVVVDPKPEPEKPGEEVYDYDIYVAGKVYEKKDGKSSSGRPKSLPGADVGQKNTEEAAISYKTDKNGFFIKQLKGGTEYEFIARMDSFITNSVIISTKGLKRPEPGAVVTLNVEIPLERIVYGKEYVLDNIYYDLDKFFIRNDAKPTLDALVRVLKLNPELNIELGSHTDCRAEDVYNLDLSQKRAQAAVDYLVESGVAKDRLLAKGYGETILADDCECSTCSEIQHQKNRRTSFKIW